MVRLLHPLIRNLYEAIIIGLAGLHWGWIGAGVAFPLLLMWNIAWGLYINHLVLQQLPIEIEEAKKEQP